MNTWVCLNCGEPNQWPKSKKVFNKEVGINDHDLVCQVCGSTFWVIRTGTKLREVPAHWKHFSTFFKLMLKEMDESFPEKGNGWLDSDGVIIEGGHVKMSMEGWLTMELESKFHEFMEQGDVEYLKHLGNFCAMLCLRKLLKENKLDVELGG